MAITKIKKAPNKTLGFPQKIEDYTYQVINQIMTTTSLYSSIILSLHLTYQKL